MSIRRDYPAAIANSFPSSPAQPSVVVWIDGQASYALGGQVIGRDPSADIVVDNAQVSRRHAALELDGGGWLLRDLGSVNGLHDAGGRRDVVRLGPGRNQVWLGPPGSSPSLWFDVTTPARPAAPPPPVVNPAPYAPAAQAPPPPPVVNPAPYAPAPQAPPPPAPVVAQAPPPPLVSPQPAPAPAPPPPLVNPRPAPAPPASFVNPQPAPAPPPPLVSPQPAAFVSPQPAPAQPVAFVNPQPAPPPPPPGPAAALNANSALLEQNLGQVSQVIQVGNRDLIVGRSIDCDISIADPLVSRRHARLVLERGAGRIIDLNSDNGTFVNGQRIIDSPLAEGDLIEMGKSQFIWAAGELRQHIAHGLPLQAANLIVKAGHQILLHDVSFSLPPGSMTAVIGPSGSGKSTLLNALTGRRPADSGRVVLGGRDLYGSDEGLGKRIGFVPQDDPVHDTLTVRQALMAAARLRLPNDTSTAEIKANVEQVATELGLAERLDTRIRALSGGQRKRVSVGYELVGTPQALILDEPTSGLDPGLERELMVTLRHLADKGTTTVVVTHSVQSVQLCDLVLVLAPGGRLAFIGEPSKVAQHFNCNDLASVFTLLGARQQADWEMEFARTTSYLRFGAPAPIAQATPEAPLPPRSFLADLKVMLIRYVLSLIGDRRRTILLVAQAPVLGLILSLVLFKTAFAPGSGQATRQYLLATVLAMSWLGGSNSVREIVQERDVFRRERAVGVSAVAYVISRFIVLAVAISIQALILHLVASSRQVNPIGPGALFGSGDFELLLALAGVGVASVGIGLLISAWVNETSKALTALPLVIIPTLLLSGLVVPTSGRGGIQQVTYLNPVQWGGSTAAVAVNIKAAENCPPEEVLAQTPAPPVVNQTCLNGRWKRTGFNQFLNLFMLVFWSAVLLAAAGWVYSWSLSRPIKRS